MPGLGQGKNNGQNMGNVNKDVDVLSARHTEVPVAVHKGEGSDLNPGGFNLTIDQNLKPANAQGGFALRLGDGGPPAP